MQNKSKGYIYSESKTIWRLILKKMSWHSKTVRKWNASSDMSPLSLKTYAWLLVSNLTTRSLHVTQLRDFFSYKVFSSLSPWWLFFICGGKCRRQTIIHTVQEYFWRTRQGRMGYVWGGQTIEAGFPKRQGKDSPCHCIDAGLLVQMQDWAFLCKGSVLDIRFLHGVSMERPS